MEAGDRVTHLFHFRNRDGHGSHALNPALVRAQARAIGLPLVQREGASYEEEFGEAVRSLRAAGVRVDGAVFGHLETHGALVDRLCRDLAIEPLMPLWKRDAAQILDGMINAGFEALVVSARADPMGREWLGRRIDRDFIRDLAEHDGSINPCGENGEFHTLVVDGPIFRKRVAITAGEPVLREGYWHLGIAGWELEDC